MLNKQVTKIVGYTAKQIARLLITVCLSKPVINGIIVTSKVIIKYL